MLIDAHERTDNSDKEGRLARYFVDNECADEMKTCSRNYASTNLFSIVDKSELLAQPTIYGIPNK